MPLSTFSFSRMIPKGAWARRGALVIILVLCFCIFWEAYWRHQGYGPTLNDNSYLWSSTRNRLRKDAPNEVVIIGSSRTLFDLKLDILKELKGRKPVQLSLVGSTPRPILQHLADDESFRGTVVVGVTPGLFFAPGGPPVKRANDALKFYKEFSPSQRIGQFFGVFLQQHLAFIQQEDLTLNALLASLNIPNRPNAKIPPRTPPHMNVIGTDRQAVMTKKLEKDPEFQERIKDIWKGLLNVPPLPKMILARIMDEVKDNVDKIRSHGGTVIFIRLPSIGWVRENENILTPRRQYWDHLLNYTQTQGIHFEDYSELDGFNCPEWSHINREDAILYTKRLLPILKGMVK